jgi:phosphoribosylaminoimidazolecarboxamide formyltransferase/IMP cyclohydrolase
MIKRATLLIRRALISVFDKGGLVDFARSLEDLGVEILSTGGTAAALKDAKIAITDVADVTGFPEILGGRVKTLHPKIHGGLLAIRDDESHVAELMQQEIETIDLVVVNLYPFKATVESGADFATCIENIDIGGPSMIRAAAKNHDYVTVVVDPEDYAPVLEDVAKHNGGTSSELRRALAAKAYAHTAAYDSIISNWFADEIGDSAPKHYTLSGTLHQTLRYGENPHQTAAFYTTRKRRPGVATAQQTQGKELSYNNINDTDAAFELISEFDPAETAAVAIIKHANPCGVALGSNLTSAYQKALACDSISAFGGIVALNRTLDAETAEEITKLFTEVIIAPGADAEALKILSAKKNLRVLLAGALADTGTPGLTLRTVSGGFLLQSRDNGCIASSATKLETVTKRAPSTQEMADLKFAFTICKHVKSNAIVYAKDLATVGIGAGQMSRVDSARIAARKAEDMAKEHGAAKPPTVGSVAGSDAFFPFPDGLLNTAEAGATAIIQPGGSIRDKDVIAAADDAGLAMVFTGMRHFRH